MRTETEIRKLENILDTTNSKFHGMTYEQGVEAALRWVLEDLDTEEFVDENNNLI